MSVRIKNLKVLLGDPRHNTVGAHSYFVPIGIGYIGSNLLKHFKKNNIELKLSVDSEEIFTLLDEWKPDIIGISNYVWNSHLSKFICEYAKKTNPNVLCVLGGPEFPAGTGAGKIENNKEDRTYDKCLQFLIDRPFVDYFAYSDGEIVLVEIVKQFSTVASISFASESERISPLKQGEPAPSYSRVRSIPEPAEITFPIKLKPITLLVLPAKDTSSVTMSAPRSTRACVSPAAIACLGVQRNFSV